MRIVASVAVAVTALAVSLIAAGRAEALELEQVGTFAKPIHVTSDPGDAGRLFVVEREGTIELVEDELASTYVDLTDVVACCEGERGLASVAFDPDFATSRKLYVAYTTSEDTAELNVGDVVVDELTEPEDPEDPFASRRVLVIPHDQFNIHNGGQLQFGPDGMLYLSTGDGGHFNPRAHPQDPESGLGKILRFDPTPDPPLGYTTPAGNPFADGEGFAPIVWALGLRNPFRFSFDELSGDLVIGDVGEGSREEIDFAPSPGAGEAGGVGDNYGWSCLEGLLPGLGASNVAACAGKGAADFDRRPSSTTISSPNPARAWSAAAR
jgi:glucose/arabinose dehydrogenase